MRRLVLVVLLSCRSGPPAAPSAPEPAAAPSKPELWVDASAPEGGDGTRERPSRAFAPRPGMLTHVATGLYEVPQAGLPPGIEVVGGKAVVLHLDGPLWVEKATFRQVAFQGGTMLVVGAVTLEEVWFSGQREVAVRVEPKGELTMSGGAIDGLVPETRGVVLAGRAALTGVTFRGALRHGVTVEGGRLNMSACRSEGAAEAVHVSALPSHATVTGTRAVGGRGPAFAVAGGRLELKDVEVSGHEQAVLAGQQSIVDVDGLKSDRASAGAVSLIGANAVLRRLTVTRAGVHGAVESLGSLTRVEDLNVREATDVAVVVRQGRATIARVRIEGVTLQGGSGGDGVMVRDAFASLEDITVIDAGGSGMFVTAFATVELNGLTCRRCAHGALVVERHARAFAKNVVSEDSREAAVSVPDDGSLELEGLEVKGEGPGVWAECTADTHVVLKGKLPPRELLSGRCIELVPASPDSGR